MVKATKIFLSKLSNMHKGIEKGTKMILAYRIDHLLFADWLPQVNDPLSALLSTVVNHE